MNFILKTVQNNHQVFHLSMLGNINNTITAHNKLLWSMSTHVSFCVKLSLLLTIGKNNLGV